MKLVLHEALVYRYGRILMITLHFELVILYELDPYNRAVTPALIPNTTR